MGHRIETIDAIAIIKNKQYPGLIVFEEDRIVFEINGKRYAVPFDWSTAHCSVSAEKMAGDGILRKKKACYQLSDDSNHSFSFIDDMYDYESSVDWIHELFRNNKQNALENRIRFQREEAAREAEQQRIVEAQRIKEEQKELERREEEARRLKEERQERERQEAEARRLEEERLEKERQEEEARRLEEERQERERQEAEARRLEEERQERERQEAEARRLEEERQERERQEAEARRLEEERQERKQQEADERQEAIDHSYMKLSNHEIQDNYEDNQSEILDRIEEIKSSKELLDSFFSTSEMTVIHEEIIYSWINEEKRDNFVNYIALAIRNVPSNSFEDSGIKKILDRIVEAASTGVNSVHPIFYHSYGRTCFSPTVIKENKDQIYKSFKTICGLLGMKLDKNYDVFCEWIVRSDIDEYFNNRHAEEARQERERQEAVVHRLEEERTEQKRQEEDARRNETESIKRKQQESEAKRKKEQEKTENCQRSERINEKTHKNEAKYQRKQEIIVLQKLRNLEGLSLGDIYGIQPSDYKKVPVHSINASRFLRNLLIRLGFTTLEDLLECSPSELDENKGVGIVGFQELGDFLSRISKETMPMQSLLEKLEEEKEAKIDQKVDKFERDREAEDSIREAKAREKTAILKQQIEKKRIEERNKAEKNNRERRLEANKLWNKYHKNEYKTPERYIGGLQLGYPKNVYSGDIWEEDDTYITPFMLPSDVHQEYQVFMNSREVNVLKRDLITINSLLSSKDYGKVRFFDFFESDFAIRQIVRFWPEQEAEPFLCSWYNFIDFSSISYNLNIFPFDKEGQVEFIRVIEEYKDKPYNTRADRLNDLIDVLVSKPNNETNEVYCKKKDLQFIVSRIWGNPDWVDSDQLRLKREKLRLIDIIYFCAFDEKSDSSVRVMMSKLVKNHLFSSWDYYYNFTDYFRTIYLKMSPTIKDEWDKAVLLEDNPSYNWSSELKTVVRENYDQIIKSQDKLVDVIDKDKYRSFIRYCKSNHLIQMRDLLKCNFKDIYYNRTPGVKMEKKLVRELLFQYKKWIQSLNKNKTKAYQPKSNPPMDSSRKKDRQSVIHNDTHEQIKTTNEVNEAIDVRNTGDSRLMDLLKSNYPYGFNYNSPIELLRLKRNYESEYGVECPYDDERLIDIIKEFGFEFDGKIYVLSQEVMRKILDEIKPSIESGLIIFYYSLLYEKNENWLFEERIVSADMIKTVLEKMFPSFQFRPNFFLAQSKRIPEQDALVSDITQAWGDEKLRTVTELCDKLPYIPVDKIKHALSVNSEYIWNSFETYTRKDLIIVSDEQIDEIRTQALELCDQNGSVLFEDLSIDEFLQNNYELSESAVLECISAYLNDITTRNGRVFTRKGDSVDTTEAIKNYCRSHDTCTKEELERIMQETAGFIRYPVIIEAANAVMVRVDDKTYVSDNMVQFDIDSIDAALADIIKGNAVGMKEITTFGAFPYCGYQWNWFLLESYCRRFSAKFKYDCVTPNSKNAGAIIKRDFIGSYHDVLIEAVARSDIKLDENDVLEYLVQSGLMVRRQYSDIDDLINKAAIIREGGN